MGNKFAVGDWVRPLDPALRTVTVKVLDTGECQDGCPDGTPTIQFKDPGDNDVLDWEHSSEFELVGEARTP